MHDKIPYLFSLIEKVNINFNKEDFQHNKKISSIHNSVTLWSSLALAQYKMI